MTARRSRFVHVELAKFISVPRAVIGSLGCKCVLRYNWPAEATSLETTFQGLHFETQ